jgi:uncharacterized membrane protein
MRTSSSQDTQRASLLKPNTGLALIYILPRVLLGIFLYHMYLTISRQSPAVLLTDSLARFQMFTSLNKQVLRSSKN